MREPGRRGLTLAELLVAVALLGLVTAGIYRAVVSGQRAYRVQSQQIDVHQTIRVAATLLPAELRELDATDGDILAMSSDSIRIRAPRHLSFLCAEAAFGPTTALTIARDPAFGLRDIDPVTDSLLVYHEGDDAWLAGTVISMENAICPEPDGRAARAVLVRLAQRPGTGSDTGGFAAGSPVRGFEPLTYLLYKAGDGRYYIGQRTGSELQPIAGPVTRHGFKLAYFDAAGDATDDRRRVAAIEIRVRGRTGGVKWLADSLVMRVALRGSSW